MKKMFVLTPDGLAELKKEHDELVAQRLVIAGRIKQARELGDLSENAEYQGAREDQDRLEARISEVEHVLQNAEVIKKGKATGQVSLGSTVRLKGDKGAKEFKVVGTMEADPLSGKISDESPIGQELLGKKVGDTVTIAASPMASYKITSIS
jgi:transcription elongation factor GreA